MLLTSILAFSATWLKILAILAMNVIMTTTPPMRVRTDKRVVTRSAGSLLTIRQKSMMVMMACHMYWATRVGRSTNASRALLSLV